MLTFSKKHPESLLLLLGLVLGILIGPLVRIPSGPRKTNAADNHGPALNLSEVERLSPSELETLTMTALSTLRQRRPPAVLYSPRAEAESADQTIQKLRSIQVGFKNAQRLLPLAKQLLLVSLCQAQAGDKLKTLSRWKEKKLINGVHRLVLDPHLDRSAEVWEKRLSEIHIGPGYAQYLDSDDEAIFLLGHELTHVAARSGSLKPYIERVTATARLSAQVEPTEDQKEDLACDFTGAEILKRFITIYPNDRPDSERMFRAFGYGTRSERLALAWSDFCISYSGGPGDDEHLSPGQTIRALFAIDPELKNLMPPDPIEMSFCR